MWKVADKDLTFDQVKADSMKIKKDIKLVKALYFNQLFLFIRSIYIYFKCMFMHFY